MHSLGAYYTLTRRLQHTDTQILSWAARTRKRGRLQQLPTHLPTTALDDNNTRQLAATRQLYSKHTTPLSALLLLVAWELPPRLAQGRAAVAAAACSCLLQAPVLQVGGVVPASHRRGERRARRQIEHARSGCCC
jgi:hypothetical protein